MLSSTILAKLVKENSKLSYSLVRDFPNYLELTTSKLLKLESTINSSIYITSIKKRENIEDTLDNLLKYLIENIAKDLISKYYLAIKIDIDTNFSLAIIVI